MQMPEYLCGIEVTADSLVEDVPFSIRVANICRYEDITTLRQLASLTENEFLRIRNAGRKSAEEVRAVLSHVGLRFRKIGEIMPIGYPVQVYLSDDELAALDRWRQTQPNPPTRAQAIRMLASGVLKGDRLGQLLAELNKQTAA